MNNNLETTTNVVAPTPPKKSGSKVIIVILLLLVIAMGGFITYDKVLKDKYFTKEDNKKDEKKEDKNIESPNDTSNKLSLFDTEYLIESICPEEVDTCDETIGKFTLGNIEHSLKITKQPYEGVYAIKVYVDNLELYSNTGLSTLDKIVKINEDYLALGINTGFSFGYEIRVYDKEFNLIKTFNSIHGMDGSTGKTSKEYENYFKVEGNTFTRYSCNCNLDSGDGTNQILEEYKITINNKEFSESKISETVQYCTPQC